ncbi:hypothetical protein PP178_04250 [Zeaxanthinibacter sp. PT1]|uniref:hypothetical protein n=1 Tax=Zeaxanthinibacter TaxID=561554 RepID=UPI0023491118|nr:hypothetical protein [Zeaxanthinibacter sp. PT1]MDC6350751.1 hypothetical protein [Zeaxanthinibacter sp. PT1]
MTKYRVINTDNYKSSYSEEVPFIAEEHDPGLPKDDLCIWVRSVETGKIYELYSWQVEKIS